MYRLFVLLLTSGAVLCQHHVTESEIQPGAAPGAGQQPHQQLQASSQERQVRLEDIERDSLKASPAQTRPSYQGLYSGGQQVYPSVQSYQQTQQQQVYQPATAGYHQQQQQFYQQVPTQLYQQVHLTPFSHPQQYQPSQLQYTGQAGPGVTQYLQPVYFPQQTTVGGHPSSASYPQQHQLPLMIIPYHGGELFYPAPAPAPAAAALPGYNNKLRAPPLLSPQQPQATYPGYHQQFAAAPSPQSSAQIYQPQSFLQQTKFRPSPQVQYPSPYSSQAYQQKFATGVKSTPAPTTGHKENYIQQQAGLSYKLQ